MIAVSGGVDSMVLLDILQQQTGLELIVAHFDHGIRPDSAKDRQLVQQAAERYGLLFEYGEGRLGPKASEATARQARYAFLHAVCKKYKAEALITAHHQDDLIETALLNLVRGTGRKGLSSLRSTPLIKRPLLRLTKQSVMAYAVKNNIVWHEDITNQDTSYLRNYIRQNIVPKLTKEARAHLVDLLTAMQGKNRELDIEIANYLQLQRSNWREIQKNRFIALPHAVACEVLSEWLRLNGIKDFDRKTIERLVVAAKTLHHGQQADVNKTNYLYIDRDRLVLTARNQ